jgi:phosphoribosylformylglycinamidine synthase
MRTTWREGGEERQVVAPLSLIVSAFAPVDDARHALTPELVRDAGETELVLIDLGRGRNRLGGSILAQVYGAAGDVPPDVDDAQALRAFFACIRSLARDGLLLAYHDRSDGGLFATVCEMAFAGHAGVTLNLDLLAYDALALDVDGSERRPELMQGRDLDRALRALFAEELGAVVQVRAAERNGVLARLREAGLAAQVIGATRSGWSATPRPCSPRRASSCSAPGRRPASTCSACATIRTALGRSSTASSTPTTRGSPRR